MGFLSSLFSVAFNALAVYGSEGWSTALDWVEVVFADFDFVSDILFCLEAYRVFSACTLHKGSEIKYKYVYLLYSCPPVQAQLLHELTDNPQKANGEAFCERGAWDCCMCGYDYSPANYCEWSLYSCAGTWIPQYSNKLHAIWAYSVALIVLPLVGNLFIMICTSGDSNSGIIENIVALHSLIKKPLLNPFCFLFYIVHTDSRSQYPFDCHIRRAAGENHRQE
jgi:hypothetical protein